MLKVFFRLIGFSSESTGYSSFSIMLQLFLHHPDARCKIERKFSAPSWCCLWHHTRIVYVKFHFCILGSLIINIPIYFLLTQRWLWYITIDNPIAFHNSVIISKLKLIFIKDIECSITAWIGWIIFLERFTTSFKTY